MEEELGKAVAGENVRPDFGINIKLFMKILCSVWCCEGLLG